MEKKVIKGYNYAATSASGATIVDDNGLVLCSVEAGKQGYFTATTDIIDVGSADVVITQIRGNFNMPITAGGGGGGQSFPEGSIVGIGPNGAYSTIGEHITYGGGMFYNDTTLTAWYGDMPNLTAAYGYTKDITQRGMFQDCINLTTFNGDLPNLTKGNNMFYGCTRLTEFRCSSLPSLTTADTMFSGCSNLTEFRCDMPSLTSGYFMFRDCTSLTEWTIDLPSGLTDAPGMFQGCTGLTEWTVDLPSGLTNASNMFFGCSGLTEWTVDLPSGLSDASYMFASCFYLADFSADLPSGLTNASNMFLNCKLNKSSVQRIADTIPDVRGVSGSHSIYIGIDKNQITQDEQNAFNATIVGKGWTVSWQRR